MNLVLKVDFWYFKVLLFQTFKKFGRNQSWKIAYSHAYARDFKYHFRVLSPLYITAYIMLLFSNSSKIQDSLFDSPDASFVNINVSVPFGLKQSENQIEYDRIITWLVKQSETRISQAMTSIPYKSTKETAKIVC